MASPPPPPPPPPPPEHPRIMEEERGRTPEGKPPIMFVTLMNIINTITNLVLGGVTIMALFLANTIATQDTGNSLKQHIYLCVIGYILLMSQAVLSFNPHNSWTQNLKFPEKRTVHWITQIAGSVLAITGSVIRIQAVETNLSSAHAVLGLIAMVFTILSLIGGATNLIASRLGINHGLIKIVHSLIGVITLTVAYLCLLLGFNHALYRAFAGDTNTTVAITLTITALVGTVLTAVMNAFRRMCCR